MLESRITYFRSGFHLHGRNFGKLAITNESVAVFQNSFLTGKCD